MTGKTYEMMWDCGYCGTKKLLGKTHRFCAECGAPQDPSKRYFPPDNEKVAVEDHHFVGADVHCPSCQEPQSAAVKHCANCGGPMQGGQAAAMQADHVVGADGRSMPVQPLAGQGAPQKSSKAGCIIGAIVVIVVGIIGFFVVNRFWTKSAEFEVTKLEWKRSIDIERFEEVKDKDDCNDLPKGAKVEKREKGKKVCKTIKKDQGDGTFKETEKCNTPKETCTFTVTKWNVIDTVTEKGDVDDDPEWPDTKVGKSKKECVGCKREGDRSESYIVHLKNSKSGDKETCSFSSEKEWKKFEKGSSWKGETGALAGDIKCDKLKKK